MDGHLGFAGGLGNGAEVSGRAAVEKAQGELYRRQREREAPVESLTDSELELAAKGIVWDKPAKWEAGIPVADDATVLREIDRIKAKSK